MSIRCEKRIYCDWPGCDQWWECGSEPAWQVRRDMTKHGWLYFDYNDYCPRCAKIIMDADQKAGV